MSRHRPLFPAPPPTSQDQRLALAHWRIDRLEATVQDHDERLNDPPAVTPPRMDVGKLAALAGLVVLGMLGHIAPDRLAAVLLGIVK